jgi:hypothetical protein
MSFDIRSNIRPPLVKQVPNISWRRRRYDIMMIPLTFFSGKKMMDSLVNCFIELCKLKGRLTVPPNLDQKPAHQSVCNWSENFHCKEENSHLAFYF